MQFSEDGKSHPSHGLTRPAQALIGLDAVSAGRDDAAGEHLRAGSTPEVHEAARLARDTVAARKAGVDQGNLLTDPPSELDAYIARLKASTAGWDMFKEGWP